MITQFIHQHMKWLVSAATLIVVAGLSIAPTAFARVVANTIDPQAIVTDNGRHLIVTGPIRGTAGERCFIRVTVTQRSTGAVAEGSVAFDFSGAVEPCS